MKSGSWSVRQSVKSLEPISNTPAALNWYCEHVRLTESLMYQ